MSMHITAASTSLRISLSCGSVSLNASTVSALVNSFLPMPAHFLLNVASDVFFHHEDIVIAPCHGCAPNVNYVCWLVREMANAGKHHGNVMAVGLGDHSRVTLAAARLHDRCDPSGSSLGNTVREREEGI